MKTPWQFRRLVLVSLALCAGAVPLSALTEFARQNINQLRSYALRGYAEAQYELGTRYLGQGDEQYDSLQAEVWLKLAAQAGHVRAEADLGKFYIESMDPLVTDLAEGERWLRTAATDGSLEAHYRLQDWLKEKSPAPVTGEEDRTVPPAPSPLPVTHVNGTKPRATEPTAGGQAPAADGPAPDASGGVFIWIMGITGALVGIFLVRLLAGRK